MKTGIFGNNTRDHDGIFRASLRKTLEKKSVEVLFDVDVSHKQTDLDKHVDQLDFVICIGGDGTFLNVARRVYMYDIPILGINYGSLGFLTNVERTEATLAIDHILENDYEIENRMMLDGTVMRNGRVLYSDTVLNDIVIKNDINAKIIHIKAFYDDLLIDNYPGDGLIVCTPTGSTAYSLSCGGPMVEPTTGQITVTPICPHILFARSFVTSSDRTIRAYIDENENFECTIKFDDRINMEIRGKDEVFFRKSKHRVSIICVKQMNFFDVLRSKLYNRGENLRKT